MLSLEQIVKNTKQKYRFNTLQTRNVLRELPFLTGVSYFKGKKEELKLGAGAGVSGAVRAELPRSKLTKPNYCKQTARNTFPFPGDVLVLGFFQLTNYVKITHLWFTCCEANPQGLLQGHQPGRCYLQAMALSGGMQPQGDPEDSKFWRWYSHQEPNQGLDVMQRVGRHQWMQEHPCLGSLMVSRGTHPLLWKISAWAELDLISILCSVLCPGDLPSEIPPFYGPWFQLQEWYWKTI